MSKKAKALNEIRQTKFSQFDDRIPDITVDNGKVMEVDRKRKIILPERRKGKKLIKFNFKDRRNMNKHADKTYVITMRFNNGTEVHRMIKTTDFMFKMKKSLYHLNTAMATFDLSLNCFHLYYVEDQAEPLDKNIIKKGDVSYFSVTPQNMSSVLDMQYVTRLAGHGNKMSWGIIVIVVIVVIVVIFLFLKSQGA